MAEKGNKGFLSGVFMGAVKLVTIGVVAAVAWQCFLDPLFLPIFHDTTNPYAMAWMGFINDTFSWIPQTIGLTPEPGLLSGIFDSIMGDRVADAAAEIASSNYVPPPTEVADVVPELDFSIGNGW